MARWRGRRLPAVAGTCALLIGVTACATAGARMKGGNPPEPTTPSIPELLAAWNTALQADDSERPVLITDPLVTQRGTWEPPIGGANKQAALAGAVRAGSGVAEHRGPGTSVVHWADGVTRTVSVLSAAEAVAAWVGRSATGCDGCTPITVQRPQLIELSAATATGDAQVPAWRFDVQGSRVRFVVIAVDPHATPAVDGLPYATRTSEVRATSTADGRLRIGFDGPPPASDGPCGTDYTAHLQTSGRVAAVVLDKLPDRPAPDDAACTLIATNRTVTIALPEPLGDTVLIDRAGQAIPRS